MLFHVSNLKQKFQTDWFESSTLSSLVIYKCCSTDFPVSCQDTTNTCPIICFRVYRKLSRCTLHVRNLLKKRQHVQCDSTCLECIQ